MATDYHQSLMDEAYGVWQSDKNMGYVEFVNSLGGKHKLAVLTGNLNYQVGNGGFCQWNLNGYSREVKELSRLLNKFSDNKAIKEVSEIIEEVKDIITDYDSAIAEVEASYAFDAYDQVEQLEEERNMELDKFDTRYYAVNEEFMKAMNELLISL